MREHEADQILTFLTHPAFQNLLQLLQKPLYDRIEKLENRNIELQQKILKIEESMGKLAETPTNIQQEKKTTEAIATYQRSKTEKENNLLISGIAEEEDENLEKKICQLLEAKFEKTGIKMTCERIGIHGENKTRPRMVKVCFDNIWEKRYIYINRIKNLQNSGIYINEDLMPDKSRLSYSARQLKKENKIHSTYTREGNVFIREKEFDEPKEVTPEIIESYKEKHTVPTNIDTKEEDTKNTEEN